MLAYSGRGHFVLREVDVNELVRENARLFRAAIAKTVTLNLELAEQLPQITADPSQVQQVVMNLITNAAEAIGSQPGVVRVTTAVRDCEAAFLSQSRLTEKPDSGRYVLIEVADTGCGMDAVTQERLFDPFFTTKFTGRGLGMSAVLGIMRGHKGAIMVESQVGRGTVIQVLFPAPETGSEPVVQADGHAALPSPVSDKPASGTVLVVDDEESVRSLCLKLVRRFGFRAEGAVDGEEAIRFFREAPEAYDCVLLDLTMPRLDGLSTFRELKRLRADVPVILCSGFTEQDATRQFPKEGLAAFVQKPYRPDELKAKLEAALRPVGK
jgi:CheY-like chemotaxis protein